MHIELCSRFEEKWLEIIVLASQCQLPMWSSAGSSWKKKNRNVLHNILAKRSSFPCRITITCHFREARGRVPCPQVFCEPWRNSWQHDRWGRSMKKTGKQKFQWRPKPQLCPDCGGQCQQTGRQRGGRGGNLSKYMFFFLSPLKGSLVYGVFSIAAHHLLYPKA